ncbi:Bug family tripartite tricarboxylate transporter substrate binding protein [Polynucleobacter kasalickyi]|uniref:Tripartite-type tricarboxylate transporter, receptor component TctC n=1 Tax=Polynucleobacter kasalickyi TaxID=1938817 RepID=A0A1W1Z8C7_9BURK|nr:tripartite tricarboxylate transporter substrate binding protein [Polynucleobacter kasalickyi]SMC44178.1 Tripartite-type tricarboxylate transporter, receptor component TctC [Polynucleobacter kasalickyi]
MTIKYVFGWMISAMLLITNLVFAQSSKGEFPDHSIRLVVPSGAGGVTDSLARLLALELSQNLGQQVFVDNRPGASGITGSQFVATSAPDGYTLLMVFPSHVTNPSLFSKLPYDTLKSFTPVSLVSSVSMVFVVPKDSPANTMNEFISYAKANSKKLNFSTVGAGSLGHLGAELLNAMIGTNITHIPYKGSPQAMTALISGETDMYLVASASSAVPYIKSKQIKILGVSTKDRLPIFPDTPSMTESIKGFDVQGWNGILAPAGTPPKVIEKLNKAIIKSVASEEFSKKLRQEGAVGFTSTPAEFQTLIEKDILKWGKVIKDANIHLD